MLDVIKNLVKDTSTEGGVKNIILWSNSHDLAQEYFESYIKVQLGLKLVGPLNVTLHSIPVWSQFTNFSDDMPWCLSMTPAELFLGNYEYGVSDQVKRTHEELIKYWMYTQQILTIQIDHTPGLDHPNIIKHEQW